MQIHHLLENSYKQNPEKNAIWHLDRWYTYEELMKQVNAITSYILQTGICKGDRVSILLENSFYYAAVYFAVLKAGCVVVGLNTDTNSDSLSYLLKDSDSKMIITQKKFIKHLAPDIGDLTLLNYILLIDGTVELLKQFPSVKCAFLDDVGSVSVSVNEVRTIDIDLAEIVYTSGSTGKPKGVMLSHLNLVSNMTAICSYLKLTEKDRILVVLPFFYIYGKSLLLTHIMMGASIVIDNRFVFPNKVLETMNKTGVTGFAGVPSTFMLLLNRSVLKNTDFKSLRYVTQAGGALAPSIQKEVAQAFAPAELFVMYGATEAAPRLSYLDPQFLESKWGSIGKPVDNVDLLISDKDGNELPQGSIGEIVARGSNIMQGYWKDSDETARVLMNGMYFTGDLGKMDEDGFLYVVGRTKEMIKVKGFRIGTKEIEEAILELEDVHEIAVIGVDDPILGEAILALIIPKSEGCLDDNAIRNHLKKKLPAIKQPKYIEFRSSFPKNESGKILKTRLKEIENQIKREN